ncbi:hypothetical protein CYMTET_21376 [Cymbomonas tetramitiformis]|uniref:Uncharacterized protein n=1 Tax=Cymbomonas tetramitiformis TaxID=36881 RepID=A0AAE0G218_9CHLO|nr:hypothetical protein CYMTET_21376 [Cymbomonas tetramitiformis]
MWTEGHLYSKLYPPQEFVKLHHEAKADYLISRIDKGLRGEKAVWISHVHVEELLNAVLTVPKLSDRMTSVTVSQCVPCQHCEQKTGEVHFSPPPHSPGVPSSPPPTPLSFQEQLYAEVAEEDAREDEKY